MRGGGRGWGEGAFFKSFLSPWVPCVFWVPKAVGQGVGTGFINQCIPLN